jgi:hypothetical protein
MKAYGGVNVQIHIFLTSVVAGGERSASRPSRFTPGEGVPGTHCIGCVGPRAGLANVGKRQFLTYRDSNSGPSVVHPVAIRHTDYAIPAPCFIAVVLMIATALQTTPAASFQASKEVMYNGRTVV